MPASGEGAALLPLPQPLQAHGAVRRPRRRRAATGVLEAPDLPQVGGGDAGGLRNGGGGIGRVAAPVLEAPAAAEGAAGDAEVEEDDSGDTGEEEEKGEGHRHDDGLEDKGEDAGAALGLRRRQVRVRRHGGGRTDRTVAIESRHGFVSTERMRGEGYKNKDRRTGETSASRVRDILGMEEF